MQQVLLFGHWVLLSLIALFFPAWFGVRSLQEAVLVPGDTFCAPLNEGDFASLLYGRTNSILAVDLDRGVWMMPEQLTGHVDASCSQALDDVGFDWLGQLGKFDLKHK